ncbi:hypothetical protein SPHINGOR109_60049 [Sphingorhabdus sp. 109]|nr:hypothetical protein SPHINGOR109_60049 [Sphingorhabdus sp. 109]
MDISREQTNAAIDTAIPSADITKPASTRLAPKAEIMVPILNATVSGAAKAHINRTSKAAS